MEKLDTMGQLAGFALDLLEHLDYTGWGDSWEREVSDNLREEAMKLRPWLEKLVEQEPL